MSIVRQIKAKLRPSFLYRPFLARKQCRQEKEYFQEREKAYQLLPDAFAPPGYLARSRMLLDRVWKRTQEPVTDPRDVRLFVVDRTRMPRNWFQAEFQRSFDAKIFSTIRHRLGFQKGEKDLVAFSSIGELEDTPTVPFQDPTGFDEAWRARYQNDLLSAIKLAHAERPVDLCFLYGSKMAFDPGTLHQIRAMGIPVALWWLDEKHIFHEHPSRGYPHGQEPLIGACDVHLTNSLEALRWYMARGAAAYYFPQGVDAEKFGPLGLERHIPVSFVGAAYGYRFEFIKTLKRAGIPIECFGVGWKNGWVKSNAEIYCRSIVSLGIGSTGMSGRMTCIKGRDFAVPSTGSFYLTTYDPELARLYHIGKEIACYRNEFDCVEQIHYYLERAQEAQAIGRAGRERCLREHTWTHRMEALLRWLGILPTPQ